MTDYPDWQSYPNAQSDNLFASVTQTLAPGLHSTDVLPAINWSSIMIICQPSAGAGQVQINHYADAAATMQIDSDTWPVNAGTVVIVRSPLRGKFVRIDITVTSAGDMTATTWSNFLSATSDRISFPVSQQNVSNFDATLAASGTNTYSPGEIAAGMALFYFKPYDATAKLYASIHAVDELGNPGQLIADFGKPAATVQQLITVPDLILQVEIDNTDAAASHSYDFSLTIPPQ
ncbi:MAG: hypothetical protein ACRD45_22800 [Bryobacteraceae bacterium]